MKRLLSILLIACAWIPACEPAFGADFVQLNGSASALSTAIFRGESPSRVRLLSLDVKGDHSSSAITVRAFRRSLTILTNALSTATNLYLATGHGLAENEIVVLRTTAGASRLQVLTSSTNLVEFTGQIGVAATAGTDTVWKGGTSWSTTVGAATLRIHSTAIALGYRGAPLCVELTGSSASIINAAIATEE